MLELIPDRGRILDLGCGARLITAELTERASVIGVDLSSEQLALARRNAPSAVLVRADMAEVAFAPNSFDAAVAFWSLIHVRRDLHADILRRLRGWLRPGGLLAGTFGSGDNPDDLNEDFYGAPMDWSHFDADTNRTLLRDAGFYLVQADEIEDEDEMPLWVIATA